MGLLDSDGWGGAWPVLLPAQPRLALGEPWLCWSRTGVGVQLSPPSYNMLIVRYYDLFMVDCVGL